MIVGVWPQHVQHDRIAGQPPSYMRVELVERLHCMAIDAEHTSPNRDGCEVRRRSRPHAEHLNIRTPIHLQLNNSEFKPDDRTQPVQ